MHISPLDIRKQPFRKVMRGFDPDAVNSFLEMVATEYESIIRQNDEFATQIKHLEQRIEGYTKIERVLNETLLTAQRATDEARSNAQKEAELVIKDAMVRAQRYEDEARNRVNILESELVALRNQRDSFLARFKSLLSTQLSLLEVVSGDLKGIHENEQKQEMEIIEETMAEVPPQPNLSSQDI
jgi:cell division initiation protein